MEELSEDQKKVVDAFNEGKNILMLGKAGCGKSYLIRYLRELNNGVKVCATTGIAAYNISGQTIHSFLGIGLGKQPVHTLVTRIRKNKNVLENILHTDILIIDEVSMLSAELFEKIDELLKTIRNNHLKPFGGMQMILSGDLFQLLPVFTEQDTDKRLIIESELFNEYFKDSTFMLTTNFRQNDDKTFSELLDRIRLGQHTKEDTDILKGYVSNSNEKKIIHLVPTNRMADSINKIEMEKLKTQQKVFKTKFQTKVSKRYFGDKKIYEYELEKQFKSRNIFELTLKVGARVMLLRNIDVEAGLVNGSLGTIKSIESDCVLTMFDSGIECYVTEEEWELGDKYLSTKAKQIPLTLAYAITIHKCQSLTLESARMDLGNCFADHMVYVALSRLRNLEGLQLQSFNPYKITINETIKNYYLDNLKQ